VVILVQAMVLAHLLLNLLLLLPLLLLRRSLRFFQTSLLG
jgi:hypothetical protein